MEGAGNIRWRDYYCERDLGLGTGSKISILFPDLIPFLLNFGGVVDLG
jgi:hypothetical protein